MSTQCLWHACRALMVGILLMVIGVSMATIGYYSNEFVIGESRNGTAHSGGVRKSEQRGLHLNNLSYMGPIVMGVGGFIVVASCVMTFEARDSAAKVVPARFMAKGSSGSGRNTRSGRSSGRTTSVHSSDSRKTSAGPSQSSRWEHQSNGLRNQSMSGNNVSISDRHALTAEFIHFSRTLGSPQRSSSIVQPTSSQLRRLSKSDSVPNLHDANVETLLLKSSSPTRRVSRHHHKHHTTRVRKVSNERTSLHRSNALRFQRFALSVDETHPLQPDSSHGSQCSVTFDPKPEIIDIVPVHKKREQRTKRSDTARKHILSRQQPIEQRDENHQQSARHDDERRPGSALSDNSVSSPRHEQLRMGGSPDRVPTRHSPKKLDSVIFSTPSVEKDFRSQLSICSEPTVRMNQQLSCQSSIEPCVPEEDQIDIQTTSQPSGEIVIELKDNQQVIDDKRERPDSLILNTTTIESTKKEPKKFLQRSQSTNVYNKKSKGKSSRVMSNDLDQIYVISSSNNCMQSDLEDYYDSIDVIHERRSKNFSKSNESETDKDKESETTIRVRNENIVETIVDIEPRRHDETA